MTATYNVYCDESCHMENDHQKAMVLGAVWCPLEKTREISRHIRETKLRHGLKPGFEIKWTKVSPGKIAFYEDLISYFFAEEDLHFRALIVPDKSKLRHADFPNQDHDVWYYKMYFDMLKVILTPRSRYRVYLDIKDTHGGAKVAKLHDVLCNNMYDFSREIIERIQLLESKQVELLQLADLLIGSVSHANRIHGGSKAKGDLVALMRQESGYSLTKTTLLREEKVNIFSWQAMETQQ
ncbi:MAG: DUF3800 domain-containing protein [Desulfobacteraceae bacterium]|nr:DUF3800 domain-containing protein [Desulfobacterales bacterium]MBL6967093.1 DUF3800 domain-containing protein [Desulfobacteraceae bacterium]MBL7101253.1 DUF3800 domain-containing protein [Desulfobacteraceae bacterium]MBL7171840.1 DUF3800 domain-containing protein [Desulfobacteraceae bacterium]MBU0734676.1 DUF3800 domain-containing protein [Pseudomonadota bacterium]